ncbi:MAG: biotin/lipoate A/B protein ligase family protein [Thermodesulfobacteriota bacterium]
MKEWRLLVDQPAGGLENMATDEAVLTAARQGRSLPTVRLYGWKEPTVSIGYRQRSLPGGSNGLPVVRRITGGRAVLHHMELTYSVVCGSSNPLFAGGIRGAYLAISGCIVYALKDVGIEAGLCGAGNSRPPGGHKWSCYHAPSRDEVVVDGRKLVGSSQRRFKEAFLQHGSILFDVDSELITEFFGEEALRGMAWVGAFGRVKVEEFREALTARLEEGLDISLRPGTLTDWEKQLKDKLVRERYATEEWTSGAMLPNGKDSNQAYG